MRIYPPIIAGIYLLVFLLLNNFFPSANIFYYPYNLLGFLILGGGLFLMIWAGGLFKKQGTTHNPYGTPAKLVTQCPFSFSRNPMYLGLTIILLGMTVLVGSVLLFFLPLVFVLTINTTFIPREEKKLEQIFAQQYLDYKNRVRRWL